MEFTATEVDLEDLELEELFQLADYYKIQIPFESKDQIVDFLRSKDITSEKIEVLFPDTRKVDPEVLEEASEIEENMENIGYIDEAILYYNDPEIIKILNYPCKKKAPFAVMYSVVSRSDVALLMLLFSQRACIEIPYEIKSKGLSIQNNRQSLLQRCSNERFIILPVIIDVGGSLHANALFFDTLKKQVEHFEPSGTKEEWYEIVGYHLRTRVEKQLPEYKFVEMPNVCIQGGPFCAAYTILYLYLRLIEPNLSSEDIIKEISKGELGIEFLTYQFVCYLYDLINEYNLQRIVDRYNKFHIQFSLSPEEEELINSYYSNLDLQGLRNLYYSFMRSIRD